MIPAHLRTPRLATVFVDNREAYVGLAWIADGFVHIDSPRVDVGDGRGWRPACARSWACHRVETIRWGRRAPHERSPR